MSRYFQPCWAYLSRSVSTTSYFGSAGQVSLCGRRGHSPGSRPAAPRAGDSRPDPGAAKPKQAAGLGVCVWWLGVGGGSVPAQMGGEASEQDATSPGAPVNLCPESVTSSRCGSLPGAKNSSFSFESFLVPGCLGPLGLPISYRPTEKKKKRQRESAPRGRALGRPGPLSTSYTPLRKGGARPAARLGLGGGERGGRSDRAKRATP